ncbi:MAG: antitoxin VapB family protein [Nanoarchaeota archaeon]
MVKVISLSNEAYEKLKSLKGNKSFSEVVVEIVDDRKTKKRSIMDFAGIWKDDSEWDAISKKIYEDRKKFKLREIKW